MKETNNSFCCEKNSGLNSQEVLVLPSK